MLSAKDCLIAITRAFMIKMRRINEVDSPVAVHLLELSVLSSGFTIY